MPKTYFQGDIPTSLCMKHQNKKIYIKGIINIIPLLND